MDCKMDCIDFLPLAIEQLKEKAKYYGVEKQIEGKISSVDDNSTHNNYNDLILTVSVIEHILNHIEISTHQLLICLILECD